MTIALIEGFDLVGDNTDLAARGWVFTEGTVNPTAGRFGGFGYTIPSGASSVLSNAAPYLTHQTVSFWFKTGVTADTSIFSIHGDGNSGTCQDSGSNIFLSSSATGVISVYGAGAVKGTSAAGVIQADVWHHIEVSVTMQNTGSADVYVDGILAVEVLSGDFLWSQVVTSPPTFSGDNEVNTFDDILVQSSNTARPPILGEHKVHTLLPSANTAQADWTGAFTDIDDPFGSTDGDTTYVSAEALNSKSEFSLGDLLESPVTIHAVQSVIDARKTDAGTKGVTHFIDSNGVREDGVEFAAAEAYGTHTAMHELNPDGNVAWTGTAVNALLVGVEITT